MSLSDADTPLVVRPVAWVATAADRIDAGWAAVLADPADGTVLLGRADFCGDNRELDAERVALLWICDAARDLRATALDVYTSNRTHVAELAGQVTAAATESFEDDLLEDVQDALRRFPTVSVRLVPPDLAVEGFADARYGFAGIADPQPQLLADTADSTLHALARTALTDGRQIEFTTDAGRLIDIAFLERGWEEQGSYEASLERSTLALVDDPAGSASPKPVVEQPALF